MYLITVNNNECLNLDTVERIVFGAIAAHADEPEIPTALVVFISTVSKKYQGEDAERLQEVCSSCLGFNRDAKKPERKGI